MSAVRLLLRSDLRRRWGSLLVVALLVGLAGGTVLAALAGARRTDSAYPRLLRTLHASDASVEVSPEYFDEIAALPNVEGVAPLSFMFVVPVGLEGGDLTPVAPTDDRFTNVLDRPRLLDGRRPDPDRVDEVLLNEELADQLGAQVGRVLTMASLSPEQLEQLITTQADPGEPAGPTLEVTVVGVVRTQEELAGSTPIMVLTPAFYGVHRDDIGHFDDILNVRLADGDDDVAAFQRDVARIVPESEGAIVETQAETSARVEEATQVQVISLLALAIATALAGFVATGQALARQSALSASDQLALHALGLSRRQRFAVLTVPAVFVAVVGAFVAAGMATLASPTMPTGFARRVEPDPGFRVDWLVLVLGFVAVAVLVSGRAALSAWRTSGRRTEERFSSGTAARVATELGRLGARPPLQAGARMALEPGSGRTAVPVRSALAGAVAGVAGLVAALTFGAALEWAVSDPSVYGLRWDASVAASSDAGESRRDTALLAENIDVGAVAVLSVLPIQLGGVPLQSYGLESLEGGGFTTVLAGRAPQGVDEVLVGSETLSRLGHQLGDTVAAAGLEGSAPRALTIVGTGVFPEFVHPAVPESDTGSYNDFALLTGAGNEAFVTDAGGEYFGLALVRWAPGVDPQDASDRLEAGGAAVQVLDRPESFVNLARVDAFPSVVAGFLVLVAVFAGAHALVMSVRRRGRDIALLKTLGFTASQVRATVVWQATTFAAVGLVLGIPAGLVVGRAAWAVVARRLGIDDHIPIPWLAVTLAIPGAVFVANIVAALPARWAARTRPAVLLRSE